MSRRYAHKIPFIVKINHNELISYPNSYDQVMFGKVQDAWNMGAAGIGATIYFGSENTRRQILKLLRLLKKLTALECLLSFGVTQEMDRLK